MNYDMYRTFIVLAHTRNFSTTAEKLNVAQSTVSNRIKELETQLGCALFNRTNRYVELTVAGEAFLPFTKRIIAIDDEAMAMIENLSFRHIVRIGSVHSAYRGHIKKALMQFLKAHEDVSVKMIINHTESLLELLADDIIDIAVVSHIPSSLKYSVVSVLKDSIILVSKNAAEFKDIITTEELKTIQLISSDMSDSFTDWLKQSTGGRINSQFYVDQIYEVFDYVLDGFGYAFVLESMAADFLMSGTVKKVAIHQTAMHIQENYVVVSNYKAENEAIKAFFSMFKEYD